MTTLILGLTVLAAPACAIEGPTVIPAGARVYVQPMDGFGTYVMAALDKKKVPVVVVADRAEAEFEIAGDAQSEKAGWAKILFTRSAASTEEASINITNIKTGVVVFAYNVNKQNAARGKQSAAESCAKHLKQKIEEKR